MAVKLSTLSICLGFICATINLIGVFFPVQFAAAAQKFPRCTPIGYILTLAGTGWFMWNVSHESLADFESLKPFLFTLFIAVGLGTCFFVRDFLAVRGLSVVLLLLGQLMVDSERWENTEWRLVIAVLAYLMVLAGMWFTVSPWRLRDLIKMDTSKPSRCRLTCGIRAAIGVFLIVLGLKVY